MSQQRADLISVVEAAYDVRASKRDWLQGICDGIHEIVRPSTGLTAHHLYLRDDGIQFADEIVQSHGEEDLVTPLTQLGKLLDARREGLGTPEERHQGELYEQLIRSALAEPADHMTHREYRPAGPQYMYDMDVAVDTFVLRNIHIDDNGVTLLVGAARTSPPYRTAERHMFQRLSAHIKSGFRLRSRLRELSTSVDVPEGGAVLDAAGKLIHAEGGAKRPQAIEQLCAATRRIDKARSQKLGRREEALAVWQGLVRGEWSLVDTVDVDGRRFVMAHRNPEGVVDPRGLTAMEARVAGLAVLGYADKLIAYHLGIAEGTASSHLARALRKLKIRSRAELVRKLGPREPNETD